MRGALFKLWTIWYTDGIIPAYAGSTSARREIPSSAGDHPRVCGEHNSVGTSSCSLYGSSPRMRGALSDADYEVDRCRIIPAHAGSTTCRLTSARSSRDHPRACGEHGSLSPVAATALGSSPRMRGALRHCKSGHLGAGIIPAHAGSTPCAHSACTSFRDHPRACGEHPPHAEDHRARLGIIPAHAGSTS